MSWLGGIPGDKALEITERHLEDGRREPRTWRVHHITSWRVMAVVCRRCGHTGTVTANGLLRRGWPDQMALYRLARLLRCTACDVRGGHRWRVEERRQE